MTPLNNCWKWITSHVARPLGVVRRRLPVRQHGHHHPHGKAGHWIWVCRSAPPLLAIPPLAWVWHPFIAPGPVAAIAPPSDTGGYSGFDSGGSGSGFLTSAAAFAGSPSFLIAPPSLPGTPGCISDCGSSVPGMPGAAVSEPNGCIIMAALLVIFAILARRQSLHARLNAPAETRTGSGAGKP
jgi:hypothetical protein